MINEIKQARLKAGLSQQKMSDLTGIPKRTIEQWDTGERSPSPWVTRLVVEELSRIAAEQPDKTRMKE